MPTAKIISLSRHRTVHIVRIQRVDDLTAPTETVYVPFDKQNSPARTAKKRAFERLVKRSQTESLSGYISHKFEYVGTLKEYLRDVNAYTSEDVVNARKARQHAVTD